MGRIVIVDEQPVTRHALRLMMEGEGYQVIAEADNGLDALQQARALKPDLMILELSIPRLGGLEVIQRLVAVESPVRVLVLTSQDSQYFAGRCLKAGAAGFVSKQQHALAVRQAVRAVLQGNSYFPAEALGSVSEAEAGVEGDLLRQLSVRELTVLQMLARGLSNIAIAEQLSISDKTVSTYKVRLMQKLRAKSLVELVDIGRRHGLVEGGSPQVAVESVNDLNEEQHHELDLLRKMIMVMPYSMTIRTLDARILFFNQAFLDLIDRPGEGIIGLRMSEIPGLLDEDEAPMIQRIHTEAMAKGEPYDLDLMIRLRSGPKFIHHWGRPYYDAHGQLIGAICGSMDVTERDQLLKDLRNANARAESANRAKSLFLMSMGSELAGPLQNIVSMLDLARLQDDPGRQGEALRVARSAATTLLDLLDELQLLNRLDANAIQLRPEAIDLRVLIEQQIEQFREQARAKGIDLSADFSLCQSPQVWVDPLRVRQVLNNLLSNAVKYTDQGHVLVGLGARVIGTGMAEILLAVTDTGIGVSGDNQAHLFEPFTQALDDSHLRRGGTGLGLALCKGLVSLMGGDITLHTQPGVGTRVAVRLLLTSAET